MSFFLPALSMLGNYAKGQVMSGVDQVKQQVNPLLHGQLPKPKQHQAFSGLPPMPQGATPGPDMSGAPPIPIPSQPNLQKKLLDFGGFQ
jgi:hypothetical protein